MEDSEDLIGLFNRKKQEGAFVKICAPMVRYSKLPFRLLVRYFYPMTFVQLSDLLLNTFIDVLEATVAI